MDISLLSPIALIALSGLVLAGLVEHLLIRWWNRPYLKMCIPFFRATIPYSGSTPDADLERALPYAGLTLDTSPKPSPFPTFDVVAVKGIVAHRLSATAVAFREPRVDDAFMIGRRHRRVPLLGTIEYRPQDRTIVVSGRLRWSSLAVVPFAGFLVLQFPESAVWVLCVMMVMTVAEL